MKKGVFLENEEINPETKSKFITRLVTEFRKSVELEKRDRYRLLSEQQKLKVVHEKLPSVQASPSPERRHYSPSPELRGSSYSRSPDRHRQVIIIPTGKAKAITTFQSKKKVKQSPNV